MKNNKISDNYVCLLIIIYINVFYFASFYCRLNSIYCVQGRGLDDCEEESIMPKKGNSRYCSLKSVP